MAVKPPTVEVPVADLPLNLAAAYVGDQRYTAAMPAIMAAFRLSYDEYWYKVTVAEWEAFRQTLQGGE